VVYLPADLTYKKMSRSCVVCGKRAYSDYCVQHKPRTPIKTYRQLNKIGKVAQRTNAAVAKWKNTQKPNHQGYWQCYICGRMIDYLIAEHVKSKVRHPELRTDPNNMKPVCNECNAAKGSKDN
jgi:5-methylcytosine-specific restriction endonuclease McrA